MLSVCHKMEAHDGKIMKFWVRCSIIVLPSHCLNFYSPSVGWVAFSVNEN